MNHNSDATLSSFMFYFIQNVKKCIVNAIKNRWRMERKGSINDVRLGKEAFCRNISLFHPMSCSPPLYIPCNPPYYLAAKPFALLPVSSVGHSETSLKSLNWHSSCRPKDYRRDAQLSMSDPSCNGNFRAGARDVTVTMKEYCATSFQRNRETMGLHCLVRRSEIRSFASREMQKYPLFELSTYACVKLASIQQRLKRVNSPIYNNCILQTTHLSCSFLRNYSVSRKTPRQMK